jgi:hypothetical protein
MKNFLVTFLLISLVLVVGLQVALLVCDWGTVEELKVKTEISLQHVMMHLMGIPHTELAFEADLGEADISTRTVIISGIKSIDGQEGLVRLEKLHYEGNRLIATFPINTTFILIINGQGFISPVIHNEPEKGAEKWLIKAETPNASY